MGNPGLGKKASDLWYNVVRGGMYASLKIIVAKGSMCVIAACSTWAAVPAAHGALVVSNSFIPSITAGEVQNGLSAYTISVLNNGGNSNNYTGSTVIAADLTIETPGSGTAGALYIDVTAPNQSNQFIADIDGEPDPSEIHRDRTSPAP